MVEKEREQRAGGGDEGRHNFVVCVKGMCTIYSVWLYCEQDGCDMSLLEKTIKKTNMSSIGLSVC